jgi:PKD repeat protein
MAAALWLTLVPWHSAGAFWPPLQNVEAWIEDGQTVMYRVYDPELAQWMQGSSPTYYAIETMVNQDGVVAWNSDEGGGDEAVGCATYDPQDKLWRMWTGPGYFLGVSSLQTADGMVLYQGRYSMSGIEVVSATYDAQTKNWRVNTAWPYLPSNLMTHDGVVAWKCTDGGFDTIVCCRVYDPQGLSWCGYSSQPFSSVSGLTIVDATVRWTTSTPGEAYERGYDPGSGQWYDGPTLPLASFVASPTVGWPPLWVWFIDMSIAGSGWNWSWDFGDGAFTSVRSPYHVYDDPGHHAIVLQLAGTAGSDSATGTVHVWGPILSINPTSHDYGNVEVGSYGNKQFMISNTGTDTLFITGQSVCGDDSAYFSIVSGGQALGIATGQLHATTIQYAPGSAGYHSATYRITHNAAGGLTDVPLCGTGTEMILAGSLVLGELQLQWTEHHAAAAYWMYGTDEEAYFEPGFAPGYEFRLAQLPPGTTTWSSSAGIAQPDSNWTYMVLAVDAAEQELCRSNRCGEHDFDLSPP